MCSFNKSSDSEKLYCIVAALVGGEGQETGGQKHVGGGLGESDENKHKKKYQLAPTDLFVLR